LAQVEKRCIECIQEKIPVGSYVAPLDQASKISSLRAVFGEVYPDPVRIVAVAPFSIPDEILPNPQDDTWSAFSVEFCGGTHLSNTSEIQNIVILQEEGIAKGIRRITAVTMDAAKEAIAKGKELSDRLQHASTSLPMDKLEDEIKLLTNEVSSSSISALDKMTMRDTLSGLSKKVFQWKKEQAAAATTQIIADIVALASSDATSVICRKDFGLEGKIAKKIMASYEKKKCTKPLFMLSSSLDNDDKKCMIVASCPTKGVVDCKEWILFALKDIPNVSYKGGGKPASAQYTIDGVDNEGCMEEILKKASTFQGV